MATTQAQLFTKFRQKVRDPNGRIWNDPQVLEFANDAIAKHEANVQYNWPENAANTNTTNLVSGTQEYALPSDFGQLDIIIIGTNTLWPQNEIGYATAVHLSINPSYTTPSSFFFRGNNIGFYPIPNGGSALIHYRKAVTPIIMGDATLPFPDAHVDALVNLMAEEANESLSGPQAQGEAVKFATAYQSLLDQLKFRFITRNPRGLNFKTQRTKGFFRQRTDNVIYY